MKEDIIKLKGVISDAQMILRNVKAVVNVAKEEGLMYDKESFILGAATILEVVLDIEADYCTTILNRGDM